MPADGDSVLDTFWDIAVVGAGYAGYAAATSAEAAGLRTILIDPACDLLWESAHARCPDALRTAPAMRPFTHAMEAATGIAADWIDPGSAEWVANELLLDSKIRRLYFATPVAANVTPSRTLRSVTFALLDRLAAISAARWIDATENGLLARLCGLADDIPPPRRLVSRYFLQHTRWPMDLPLEIDVGVRGAKAVLEDSGWSSERILRIETGPSCNGPHLSVVEPAFRALRKAIRPQCRDALVSHWSYRPYPIYRRREEEPKSPCANLALAIPALSSAHTETLGDRWGLGFVAFHNATAEMRGAPRPQAKPKATAPKPAFVIETDVCVAGFGTAGLFAACAAARGGANVLAVEARAIPGGIPAIGGIHSYYKGCPGGMQDELDAEVARLSPLFATRGQIGNAYHGLARLLADDEMARADGVSLLLESRIIPGTAEVADGRVMSVLAATPHGIAKIAARTWIDSTGDAVLASSAGVPTSSCGPDAGYINPFSQVWGCFGFKGPGSELALFIHNKDHGRVDPADSLDMTRARIESTHALVEASCVRTSNSFNRTTGIAPAIGIRQGPLAATRYRLTIDDLVGRRRFDDAIGITAAHIDVHVRDFSLLNPTLAFYCKECGLWYMPTGCQIPYRAILAEGIGNLLVACRAAGVTEETAVAFRMQHDMQRIGEAAGAAAAIATRLGVCVADIPYADLKAALATTGALAPWEPEPVDEGKYPGLAKWLAWRASAGKTAKRRQP